MINKYGVIDGTIRYNQYIDKKRIAFLNTNNISRGEQQLYETLLMKYNEISIKPPKHHLYLKIIHSM